MGMATLGVATMLLRGAPSTPKASGKSVTSVSNVARKDRAMKTDVATFGGG
jgi:hypothetical protein